MTNASLSASDLMGPDEKEMTRDKIDQLLAIRGMLAYGILPHALQKRHLVDYGVNRY